MLIEFGRKGTTFLPNTGILCPVFCYFFKILLFVSVFSFSFEKYQYICVDKPL